MGGEPAAWSIAGFVLRRAVSPFLGQGVGGCAARRCGNRAEAGHRYCCLHEDVLLASVGSDAMTRSEAARRLSWLARGTRRRLEIWAAWRLAAGGVVDLTRSEPQMDGVLVGAVS